ncbi:cellulase family glycosylhydrolase [Serratia marcescens]|uniref:cellulase family glycosylhydrolase n=1 Tax=Serratia marcescens TaxID=615 RepID=UPI002881E449|nr:cellulase family glycosylhydrolase [Serratia marcescens]MDT0207873.1 glycoside hydrolase family 5 protein [Serratia marcescens]
MRLINRRKCSNRVALFFISLLVTPSVFSFELGVSTHMRNYPRANEFYLDLMKKDGFNSVRFDYDWSHVEENKGVYEAGQYVARNDDVINNELSKYGFSGLVILGYGNNLYNQPKGYPRTGRATDYPRTPEAIAAFANYAYWVASRFKGKVKYYEVWNEWLYGTGNIAKPLDIPPPEVFYQLVKQTSAAIRKADPNAIILTGSFNPITQSSIDWFDSLIRLGILDEINGIALHPYGYRAADKNLGTPEGNLAVIDNYERHLKNSFGKEVPLYITEIGVPNYSGQGGLDFNSSAQFVVKYTLMAKARPYIKGVWWYDLINDGTNPRVNEHNFGLYNANGSAKPAAIALQRISAFSTKYKVKGYQSSQDGRVKIEFVNGDESALVFWRKSSDDVNKASMSFMHSLVQKNKTENQPFIEMKTTDSYDINSSTPIIIRSKGDIKSPW